MKREMMSVANNGCNVEEVKAEAGAFKLKIDEVFNSYRMLECSAKELRMCAMEELGVDDVDYSTLNTEVDLVFECNLLVTENAALKRAIDSSNIALDLSEILIQNYANFLVGYEKLFIQQFNTFIEGYNMAVCKCHALIACAEKSTREPLELLLLEAEDDASLDLINTQLLSENDTLKDVMNECAIALGLARILIQKYEAILKELILNGKITSIVDFKTRMLQVKCNDVKTELGF